MLCLGSTKQVARKPHRCDSCCGRIEAGEVYHRARVVDCGDAWVWKAHFRCLMIGEILAKHGIEGDDGALLNVADMDADDWRLIREVAPQYAPGERTHNAPCEWVIQPKKE